ncbi:MAG: type II CRISPR-associated endonuclease Cas1, partial [Mycoplasmatales bacterium]
MSFRQIIVKDSNYLSLKDNNLLAKYSEADKEIKIPIEDIAIILIESDRTTLSVKLINKLSQNNIMLIICDEAKKPASIVMPLIGHYRQLENFYFQLGFKEVSKQNLWREIIKQKICNQREVVRLVKGNTDVLEKLFRLEHETKRNDITNREALAARIFFEELYGTEFKRFVDDKINNTLNFGYTIIVSSIMRQLAVYGLDMKLGIWHKSKSNMFNLAYDLVEPFRPLVDYFVCENYEFINKDLSPMIRKKIVGILNVNVLVNKQKYRLQNALEIYIK